MHHYFPYFSCMSSLKLLLQPWFLLLLLLSAACTISYVNNVNQWSFLEHLVNIHYTILFKKVQKFLIWSTSCIPGHTFALKTKSLMFQPRRAQKHFIGMHTGKKKDAVRPQDGLKPVLQQVHEMSKNTFILRCFLYKI